MPEAKQSESTGTLRFGDYELDPKRGVLSRKGMPLKIQPQPLRVLELLVTRAPGVVTRGELSDYVWGNGVNVDLDQSLNFCVRQIRSVLGDSASKSKFIDTLPKQGYRFIRDVVREVSPSAVTALLCQVDMSEETLREHVALNLLETVRGSADKELGKDSSPGAEFLDSIAVLPFENAGGEPDVEYLSDGITMSIINNLSQLNGLRVVPRTTAFQYKGKVGDVAQAGRELRVRVVLTGRVSQRGDALTINVELIDTTHESQLWGGDYHGRSEDILPVQIEIAGEIANRLRLRLNYEEKKQLAQHPTKNREAYYLYLKAVHWGNKWTPEGMRKGIDYARQAIDADPAYAEAWTALAYLYMLIGSSGGAPPSETFPKAKAAVLKALEIDDGEADAHAILAYVRLVYDWDWTGAREELVRAIDLGPNLVSGYYIYSSWYLSQGLYEEAIREAKLALSIDPLSSLGNSNLGVAHYFARQYDQAIEQLQIAIDLDPLFGPAHQYLAFAYARKGMRQEAIAMLEKGRDLAKSNFRSKGQWGIVNALTGTPLEARKVLDELKQDLGPPNFSSAYHSAVLHALLGEIDEAFACLEMAWHGRAVWLAHLAVAPHLESLYGDPRFLDLWRRIRIPASRT